MIIVPTRPKPDEVIPDFFERVVLDGVEWLFRFQWNGRDGHWYMSIRTSNGDPVLLGHRLVMGAEFLRRRVAEPRPAGWLFLISPDGSSEDPGYEDLGTRVSLVYATAAEVTALGAP